MKKTTVVLTIAFTFLLYSICIADEGEKTIDGFQDFKWLDSANDILEKKTADLKEGEDYEYKTYDDDYSCLIIFKSSAAGYDAEEGYNFLDDKLFSGGYEIDFESSSDDYLDKAYNDIIEKYTTVYGDASGMMEVKKDDTYSDTLTYWADDNKNIIAVMEYFGSDKKISIIYIIGENEIGDNEALSDFIDVYHNRIERLFGINVQDEVNRKGNTEGI